MSTEFPTMPGDMSSVDPGTPEVTQTPPEGGEDPAQNAIPDGQQQQTPPEGEQLKDGQQPAADTPKDAATKSPDPYEVRIKEIEAQNARLIKQIADMAEATKQGPSTPAVPARNFNNELADLRKQRDEGEISMSEYDEKALDIMDARNKAAMEQMLTQSRMEMESQKYLDSWYKLYPDYNEVVASGKLESVKEMNPMFAGDETLAYMAYKNQEIQSQMETKIKEAEAAAEKRVMERLKAKGRAAVLGDTPGFTPNATPEGSKKVYSKDHGGLTKALASRLEARRNAKTG